MDKSGLKRKFPKLYKMYLKFKSKKEKHYVRYLCTLDRSRYPYELAKLYKKKIGKKLDLNNVRTYNEKMQWAKLYDSNPLKTTLSDKYLVRNWVKQNIDEKYLIPLLGVWNSFDEIDFDKLPAKFVLKTNHGSGTNQIVKNKGDFDQVSGKRQFDEWMKTNFAFKNGFEMHYADIKPKIIAEEYIESLSGDLRDFKFLCFGGEVYYCRVESERFKDHRRNVYDLNWNLQEWQQDYYKNTDIPVEKPKNFDEMIEIAQKLCNGFSHVRVDLYNVDGKIYFGEMTFTNGSGFGIIHPYKYNLMLGDLWKLPIC